MSKVTEAMLDKLFVVTVQKLTAKIKSGEASAGDFSAAIKLLKDNNIVLDLEDKPDTLKELEDIINGFTFDDVETYSTR